MPRNLRLPNNLPIADVEVLPTYVSSEEFYHLDYQSQQISLITAIPVPIDYTSIPTFISVIKEHSLFEQKLISAVEGNNFNFLLKEAFFSEDGRQLIEPFAYSKIYQDCLEKLNQDENTHIIRKVLDKLINYCNECNGDDNQYKQRVFESAIENNYMHVLEASIYENGDILLLDDNNGPASKAVATAILYDYIDVLRKLTEKFPATRFQKSEYNVECAITYAFNLAISDDRSEMVGHIVKFFLENNLKLPVSDFFIDEAINNNYFNTMNKVIRENSPYPIKKNVFLKTVKNGQIDMVKILLRANSVNTNSEYLLEGLKRALLLPVEKQDESEKILEAILSRNNESNNLLNNAMLNIIREFLTEKYSFNIKVEKFTNFIKCVSNSIKDAELLEKLDIDSQITDLKMEILHRSIEVGDIDTVVNLLNDESFKIPDTHKEFLKDTDMSESHIKLIVAFNIAIEKGTPDLFEFLCKEQQQRMTETVISDICLIQAINTNRILVVDFLITPNSICVIPENILNSVILNGNEEMVKILFRAQNISNNPSYLCNSFKAALLLSEKREQYRNTSENILELVIAKIQENLQYEGFKKSIKRELKKIKRELKNEISNNNSKIRVLNKFKEVLQQLQLPHDSIVEILYNKLSLTRPIVPQTSFEVHKSSYHKIKLNSHNNQTLFPSESRRPSL